MGDQTADADIKELQSILAGLANSIFHLSKACTFQADAILILAKHHGELLDPLRQSASELDRSLDTLIAVLKDVEGIIHGRE